MQKAEQVQSQPAARQGGIAIDSPQGEQIAQAIIEASPQTEKLGGLASMMNAGMTAQRKLFDGITNSPAMTAQRKRIGNLFGTAQLKEESASKPNNTGLPDNLKSGIENLSGMAMDHVKVHYNSSQPAQLNALAYAQGSDIHVAPGQERHLPHEAWHVVQQAQGRVKPTMQMKDGVPVNDDSGLEHEADVMGERAVQLTGEQKATLAPVSFGLIQRKEEVEQDEESAEETPVGGELDAENSQEHEGNEGGPGDDDRIKKKRASAQSLADEEQQGKNPIQRMLSNTIQRARGYVRGASTAAALAIAESVSGWAMGGLRGFAPVPRNADQAHTVNGTDYTYRNDANGWVEFVHPGGGYGPALIPTCTVDIRPWFGPHNKAIKNSIQTTRYNHFLAANEARAAGLTGYPNNVIHDNDEYDDGYDNNPDGGSSPAGLTWHHHGSPGKMELIDRDVHAAFRHSGGYSAWGS